MKRLLVLMAVALMTCSAVGCECCGGGNMGLLQMFRGRSRCNSCSPCDSSSPCNSYQPVIQSGGCGCGGGGGEPIINAPTIAPSSESYTISHR